MHQPVYRDPMTGESQAPWTYLHAIKDYTDMAAHLEAHPGVHAVVNFSATLLDQIEEYAAELDRLVHDGGLARDPLLAALYGAALPEHPTRRAELIRSCLHAHRQHMIDRHPHYRGLADMANWALSHPDAHGYLNDGFLSDLLVWYHLSWLGETVRRDDERVRRLIERERNYTLRDRHELIGILSELVSGLVPRYRSLAESGQVELSVTPYSHPILPLLLDFRTALQAHPECPLPASSGYPGGEARARWQLAEARACFERHFGHPPTGCWPAEGAISDGALRLIAEAGFRWAASGQGVLRNSLADTGTDSDVLHRPYQPAACSLGCFFRDDDLSDAIGFEYKDWHGDDAVSNLVSRLEEIARQPGAGRVVPIILDGENAWEHYPENAFHFISGMYRALTEHQTLRSVTFSMALGEQPERLRQLPRVIAGSWVFGTFSTWIGDPDKNRAWDLLVEAKHTYDAHRAGLPAEAAREADHQLALCEASDWFWWLGDHNPEPVVAQFERLFRLHLTALYRALHVEPPEHLAQVLSHGIPHGDAETMRRSRQ